MTATDELRRLLDERGVEHEDSELIDHGNRTTTYYTEWGGNDDGDGANVYVEYMDGTVLRMFDATPEQAIAATLGNDGVERSNDGVDESDQLKGRLTAEQVRAAIFNGSGYASFDGVKYYADGIEMQAIADELNATRGRTTTRNTMRTVYGNPRPVCEVCGYGIGDKRWHYCPKCGARIKGAK